METIIILITVVFVLFIGVVISEDKFLKGFICIALVIFCFVLKYTINSYKKELINQQKPVLTKKEYIITLEGDTAWAVYDTLIQKHYQVK